MLDEADAIFGKALKGDEKAEALRGILNAGLAETGPTSGISDVSACAAANGKTWAHVA